MDPPVSVNSFPEVVIEKRARPDLSKKDFDRRFDWRLVQGGAPGR